MQETASFDSLGLSNKVLSAIKKLGYTAPTPIQSESIPIVLKGKDLIAAAETGTGKTAAFLLPLLSELPPAKKQGRAPKILIVSPTRELAEQIAKTSYSISKSCNIYTVCLFGGKPYGPQIQALKRGCDVLVATPGRLCDLMNKGSVDLSQISAFVLDEADRMLDMGFLPDIKKIVSAIPEERQTLLFSATIDESIQKNFSNLLKDPETVQIASHGQASRLVDQYILPVSQKEKPELLKCLLDEKGHSKVIVFARTKSKVDGVANMLKKAGFDVAHIHSNKTQGQRCAALSDFKNGRAGILVATDVLARGIDIPSVEYVVNYDLPDMAEDYIHRIGRTGRAGNIGFAVSFVSNNSLNSLHSIENLLGKEIPVMRISSYDIDLQILKAKSRSGNQKRRKPVEKSKSSTRSYNYDGWKDKQSRSKSSKNSKGSKRDSKKKKAESTTKASKGFKRKTRKSRSEDSVASAKRASKRPGFRSSGLSRGRR